MSSRWHIHRRTALKGLGLAMALPLLEQMGWADEPKRVGKAPIRIPITDPTAPTVFNQRTFLYSMEARAGAGYGLPFLVSGRPLTDTAVSRRRPRAGGPDARPGAAR
jgi:hypothetical protein